MTALIEYSPNKLWQASETSMVMSLHADKALGNAPCFPVDSIFGGAYGEEGI